MPTVLDFSGFPRCLYINFLSANGIIEVPPTTTRTHRGKNLWLLNTIRFHSKILFQTVRICSWMMSLPFFNFWSSTLTFPCLSRLLFTTLFTSVSAARGIIPLPLSFPPSSCKNLFHPYGYPAYPFAASLQRTQGFLWVSQGP